MHASVEWKLSAKLTLISVALAMTSGLGEPERTPTAELRRQRPVPG